MNKFVKTVEAITEYSNIVLFRIMFSAVGLVVSPTGVIIPLVTTYGIPANYYAIAIVFGLLIKILARGNVWLRLLGVLPFTVFMVLSVSLWPRGITGLVQVQIFLLVFWLMLCRPLLIDMLTGLALWSEKRRNAPKTD